MGNGIEALFSWQLLLFSLGIFAVVWVIRTIVEYFIPKSVGSNLWEKLILPLAPVVLGSIVAFFATKYAYPDGLSSVSARLMFGSVSGMLSGLVYSVVKGMLKDKIKGFMGNSTENPPANDVPKDGPTISK